MAHKLSYTRLDVDFAFRKARRDIQQVRMDLQNGKHERIDEILDDARFWLNTAEHRLNTYREETSTKETS